MTPPVVGEDLVGSTKIADQHLRLYYIDVLSYL